MPEGHLPVDLAKVGLLSRHAPVFAIAAAGSTCKDPTCQMISFAWGAGDSTMFEHRNLHPTTHARLREVLGPPPLSFYAHLRKMANEHAVVRSDLADARYDALPRSALDVLDEWQTPLLLINGAKNKIWTGSMELCRDYLHNHHPRIDVSLVEIPGYGHIDTIIGLPANLFYSTGIPVCILVLKKCKKPDDVLFINAAEHFVKGKRQNQLTDDHIAKIIKTYQLREEEARYSRRVEMSEIEKNDFNLNISRYISTSVGEAEIDLGKTHQELVELEKAIAAAKDKHNAFLKELGLKPLP